MELANGPCDFVQGIAPRPLGSKRKCRPGEHRPAERQLIDDTHLDVVPTRQRFLRLPIPDEWSRFRVYARRMISVYPPQNDHVPSEDILHSVNLHRSMRPLMPRLQLIYLDIRPANPYLT